MMYRELYLQVSSVLEGETDWIANQANIAAMLKETFGFLWVGFYRVEANQLILGPYQGPLACTRIPFDKGVCGYAYRTKQTVVVPNVNDFPEHIACSSEAKSEIVVPIFDQAGELRALLDIDSEKLNDFTDEDSEELGKITNLLRNSYGVKGT